MSIFNENSPVIARANVSIDRPPETVFWFVGEQFFANYPRWSPEVRELKQIGPGPVRKGMRARQVRVDLGHRSESIFAVTAFEPDHRICFEGVSCPYRCDYLIEEAPSGCAAQVSFTFELKNLEIYLRPFERLVQRAIREGVDRTVRTLKCLVEAETGPPPDRTEPEAGSLARTGYIGVSNSAGGQQKWAHS